MSYVDKIVQAFSGSRKMAAEIGKSPSTVMSWKVRGSIPDAQKPAVLEAARRLGLDLSEADFFPVATERPAHANPAAATNGAAA